MGTDPSWTPCLIWQVCFEDTVAVTSTIADVDNPRWHAECARGFRFPIFSPHSSLRIGLFDSDADTAANRHRIVQHSVA
jgi:hypothetical protein